MNGESESPEKNIECHPESPPAEESPEPKLVISSRYDITRSVGILESLKNKKRRIFHKNSQVFLRLGKEMLIYVQLFFQNMMAYSLVLL